MAIVWDSLLSDLIHQFIKTNSHSNLTISMITLCDNKSSPRIVESFFNSPYTLKYQTIKTHYFMKNVLKISKPSKRRRESGLVLCP